MGLTKERMVFFMSILQTTELKKYYGSKPNITKALDGVTLSIEDGSSWLLLVLLAVENPHF